MAGPVTLRNAVDTWTNGQAGGTKKNYASGAGLRMRTGGAGTRYAWLYFSLPFPRGATIQSAKLRMYVGSGPFGVAVSAQRAAAAWSVNKITDANDPAVTGAVASSGTIAGAYGTEILIDVTALMQVVSNGGVWYGFRCVTAGTGDNTVISANNQYVKFRPTLEITWIDAPKPPTVMSPAGNRAVANSKPILTCNYVDPSADSPMASIQVQVDPAANWSAPAFDSGEVASSVPQLDLASTAYAGLAVNASTYWRVRVKDSGNLWSGWSHTVNGTGNQFRNITKGTVTINNPANTPNNFVTEPTPPIDWSVTGATQKHYAVTIVRRKSTGEVDKTWTTGKITSTTTVVTPPSGLITDQTATYDLTVSVWDTVDREQNGSDPVYLSAKRTFTYQYDATIDPVTGLAVADHPTLPAARLTWSRAIQPDEWAIVKNGKVIDQINGADAFVSGTSYAYNDLLAIGREQASYSVVAVVNNKASASNPSVNFTLNLLFPWIMRSDGTNAIALLGRGGAAPAWTMQYLNDQELHDVVGDFPPVVFTQSLGGYSGHVEGLIMDDTLPGVSAKTQRDSARSMRNTPGALLVLKLANESMLVSAYNWNVNPVTFIGQVGYWVSFDYVQAVY